VDIFQRAILKYQARINVSLQRRSFVGRPATRTATYMPSGRWSIGGSIYPVRNDTSVSLIPGEIYQVENVGRLAAARYSPAKRQES